MSPHKFIITIRSLKKKGHFTVSFTEGSLSMFVSKFDVCMMTKLRKSHTLDKKRDIRQVKAEPGTA